MIKALEILRDNFGKKPAGLPKDGKSGNGKMEKGFIQPIPGKKRRVRFIGDKAPITGIDPKSKKEFYKLSLPEELMKKYFLIFFLCLVPFSTWGQPPEVKPEQIITLVFQLERLWGVRALRLRGGQAWRSGQAGFLPGKPAQRKKECNPGGFRRSSLFRRVRPLCPFQKR